MFKDRSKTLLAIIVGSVLLLGSNAYGQRIKNQWVYEKWTTGSWGIGKDYPKAAENYYLMKPYDGGKNNDFGVNAFLKYESEATLEPYDATLFTFSDEDSDISGTKRRYWYKISCYDGSRRVYVYSSNGNGKWGDDNTKQWCVESSNASKNQYIIWQNDPDDLFDPRLMAIQNDGSDYAVSYLERKNAASNPSLNDWVFISEAQYNALYPENLIRASLGYNKIKCRGVYWPNNNGNISAYDCTIEAYKSDNGIWLSRINLNKQKGIRLGTKIENLVAGETYVIEVYVYATMASTVSNATYSQNAALAINNETQNIDYFNAYRTTGCSAPILKTIEVTPDASGSICLGVWVDAVEYAYFGIKSISYKDPLYTTSITSVTPKYYLYNTETDKFLDAGSTSGNTAIVGHGLDLKLNNKGSNIYSIDTKFSTDPTYNFFNGTSMNGGEADITFVPDNGYFRLHTWGKYIYTDGTTVKTSNDASGYSSGLWQLMTEDQRKRELKRATVDNPKDATFLIKQPGFSKYNSIYRPYSDWEGYDPSTMTQDGATVDDGKNCHLKITKKEFNIYQDLHTSDWDVPNGLYLVSAQGIHNDPNNLRPIVELYANETASPFSNLVKDDERLTDGTVAAHNFDSGMYKTALLVNVTDGKLRVGARGNTQDGESGVDNFEVTYYGKYNTDTMDVTTLFITNPSFQGSGSDANSWKEGWTADGFSRNLGNNNMSADNGNTYQGYGYFADSKGVNTLSSSTSSGYVYQKIYIPAGAYQLSAKCVAQNNPGYLFVKEGDYDGGSDMGQHIVFIDKAAGATKRVTNPQERKLTFIVPVSCYVTIGYRHSGGSNSSSVWNAVDDFRLMYLGNAANTDITCQIVNPGLDADNQNLTPANFGWAAESGSTGFYYGSDCGERFYSQTSNSLFNTFQTVKGLPNGWYKIGVQGFYRDGWGTGITKNRQNAFLYANRTSQYLKLIDTITPDATKYGTGDAGYPNNMAAAQAAFSDGLYKNEVIARVTDGNLTIGVVKDSYVEGDWAIFDNFSLTYLYSDANVTEGMEFTQFIKNPSFETSDYTGWTPSKNASVRDNKGKDIMDNGKERYLATTGDSTRLGYYHIEQTISGDPNGLPQGQYSLTAKITSVEDNDIAVFVNNRTESFITDGSVTGREIELTNIGVNDNEEFNISFTSNYGFTVDEVRLFRSSREGAGDALIVDLDGLINQAKAILESGFVGKDDESTKAFQINGKDLQDAYDEAVSVNSQPAAAYSEKVRVKKNLTNEIEKIQTATPKQPLPEDIYMVKHIASGFYLTTDGEKVFITNTPSRIQFEKSGDCPADDCTRYNLSNSVNASAKYINSTGDKLSTNATTAVPTAFRIIFINGIPSHIALTDDHFKDGTCYGTQGITSGNDVYNNTDATDGYSRWIISTWEDFNPVGTKYIYNIEAGAFLGAGKANTKWNTQACLNSEEGTDNDYVIIPWTLETSNGLTKFRQDVRTASGYYLKYTDNYPFVDGNINHEYALTKIDDNGIYKIGIDPDNATYGSAITNGETYMGWSGETNYMSVMPFIFKDDEEPRGISWAFYPKIEYDHFRKTVQQAHSARMSAWPVLRAARRSEVDTKEFEITYNSPYSTAAAINLAVEELKNKIAERSIYATISTKSVDYSYYTTDLDCQATDITSGGWINSGFTKGEYQGISTIYRNPNVGTVLGRSFYEVKVQSGTVPDCDIHKTIGGLPIGKYIILVDINAAVTSAPKTDITGVTIYAQVNDGDIMTTQYRFPGSDKTDVLSGIYTDGIGIEEPFEIKEGDKLTIGIKTKGSNADWVAFDNFRLRYVQPYHEVVKSTVDNVTTLKYKGYWRGADNAEASKAVNDQNIATKNNDLATTIVDMEDAEIVTEMDLTFTNPNKPGEKMAGNTLVWTPADAPVTINGLDQNVIKDGKCTSFVVTDGKTLVIPKEFKANNVKYVRKVSTSYATIVLPFELETDDEIQLYRLVKGDGEGRFYIERISNVAAGIPAFVRKINKEAASITVNRHSDVGFDVITTKDKPTVNATEDALKLVGSYVYGKVVGDPSKGNTGNAANNYYYIKQDKFWKGNNWFYGDAFRAYIDATDASAGVRSRSSFELMEFEMPNDIETTENDKEIVKYYNSNGIETECLKPGVNIIMFSDGRVQKVYVK